MITSSDSYNTVDLGRYFAILPSAGDYSADSYLEQRPGERIEPGFSYNSGTNDRFLTVDELRQLIAEQVGHPLPLEATS
jgi:hypothetical protein